MNIKKPEYTPNRWVLIEFISEEFGTIRKVFAGWSGGYVDGDSWKLNSGIKSTIEYDSYFDFVGYSDSVYRCYKTAYGMTSLMSSVYNQFVEDVNSIHPTVSMRILDEQEAMLHKGQN